MPENSLCRTRFAICISIVFFSMCKMGIWSSSTFISIIRSLGRRLSLSLCVCTYTQSKKHTSLFVIQIMLVLRLLYLKKIQPTVKKCKSEILSATHDLNIMCLNKTLNYLKEWIYCMLCVSLQNNVTVR